MSHFSAIALAVLGRTLLLEVPDAEQRARVIDGICPLLPGSDRSVLRITAGLPNKADPWVERATDIADRYAERMALDHVKIGQTITYSVPNSSELASDSIPVKYDEVGFDVLESVHALFSVTLDLPRVTSVQELQEWLDRGAAAVNIDDDLGALKLITVRDLGSKGQQVSRAIDNWQIKFNEELIYPDSNFPEWMCDWTDPNLMWIYRADADDRDPGDEHQCRP